MLLIVFINIVEYNGLDNIKRGDLVMIQYFSKGILIFLIISLALINPISIYANNENEELFSKEEIKKDIEVLFDKLDRIHPNLYFSINKDEIDSKIQKVLNDVDGSIGDVEFYKKITPIISQINDGHTFTSFPKSLMNKISSSESLIPIQVAINNSKKLFIENILTEECYDRYKGYEILSINSKDSNKIYDEMKNYVFGKQEFFREAMVAQNFITLYYLYNDFQDEYTLELKGLDNKITKLKIDGKSVNEVRGFLKEKLNTQQKQLYEYKVLDDNIALIEFNSFTDFDGFKVFLDKTFKDINDRGINDLIIDLRENGGGNSSLGDLLVEYIYDGNYKSVSSLDIKISEEIIKYYGENNDLSEEELNNYKTKIGEKYTYTPKATRMYRDECVFHGDTYFLIGKNTFSSAVMLASIVKDYNIGYLIGEETGGLVTHYGDIYSFVLPNTKLNVGVSHKYFVRPNGLNTGRGVLPDYYEKDLNKDALDIAIDIIKTKRQ